MMTGPLVVVREQDIVVHLPNGTSVTLPNVTSATIDQIYGGVRRAVIEAFNAGRSSVNGEAIEE
jgi:hypothetical protein